MSPSTRLGAGAVEPPAVSGVEPPPIAEIASDGRVETFSASPKAHSDAPVRGAPGRETRAAVVRMSELTEPPPTHGAMEAPLMEPAPNPDPAGEAASGGAVPPGRFHFVPRVTRELMAYLFAPMVLSPAPSASFLARGDSGWIPPDTHGTVGPNHLMVSINGAVRVQNKAGGVLSDVTLNAFWTPVGFSAYPFDPKTIYDPYGDRWITCACADPDSATSAVLIGVSQTNDPTGAWNLYSIDADPADIVWADYPSIGFNKDWIVLQMNMFPVSGMGGSFRSHIYTFKKADLYAGIGATHTLFSDGAIGGTQVPAQTFDPALATMYLLQTWNGNSGGNGFLRLYSITGPVGAEVFGPVGFISTPATWSDSSGFPNGNIFPQAGIADRINSLGSRMLSCVYRNGSIWGAHNVFLPTGAPDRASVQWWEVTPAPAVTQRGRIDDPTATIHYGYPSLAVNAAEDVLVGFSQFSATTFASAAYAFRAAGDPVDTMRDPVVLKAGENSYAAYDTYGRNRWGDYSNTAVDPTNDTDFWTIQEYASATANDWSTWWGKVVPPVASPTAPTNLTPTALTSPKPKFTAQHNDPESDAADKRRLEVNTAADFSGTVMWDEGVGGVGFAPSVAAGAQSQEFLYAGSPLNWNTTYYWRMTLWDVLGNESDPSATGSFTMGTPAQAMPNPSGWQMVGVPSGASVSSGDVTGIGGTYYWWNEATGAYEVATTLEPGRGYFVATSGTAQLNAGQAIFDPFAIGGLSATPGATYSGWHMIGNVYNGTISWDTIYDGGFTTNLEAAYAKWDGTQYVTYNALTNTGAAGATIGPFQAFWVRVVPEGAVGSLTLQPPSFAEPGVPTPFDANWWLLQVAATSGTLRDDQNWVGVHALADDGWDARDASDPTTIANPYVRVYVEHADWAPYPDKYQQDVRKTPYDAGAVVAWTITVEVSNAPMEVTISFPNLADMPAEWSFDAAEFTYMQATPTAQFTIAATRTAAGVGTLEVKLGGATPAGGEFVSGETLGMMQVELIAAGEDIVVDPLPVFAEGTASVGAIALEPVYVAEGTSQFVWVEFQNVTGDPGAFVRAILEPGLVTAAGQTTGTSIAGNGVFIEGPTMAIPAAEEEPVPVEADVPVAVGGGGGSGSGCAAESVGTADSLWVLFAVWALALARRFDRWSLTRSSS